MASPGPDWKKSMFCRHDQCNWQIVLEFQHSVQRNSVHQNFGARSQRRKKFRFRLYRHLFKVMLNVVGLFYWLSHLVISPGRVPYSRIVSGKGRHRKISNPNE